MPLKAAKKVKTSKKRFNQDIKVNLEDFAFEETGYIKYFMI